MRKSNQILILFILKILFVLDVCADVRKRYHLNEKITVIGRFDSTTIPYRLIVEEKTENEEYILLKNIKSSDSILYHNLIVTVKGKVVEGTEQYLLDVTEISR